MASRKRENWCLEYPASWIFFVTIDGVDHEWGSHIDSICKSVGTAETAVAVYYYHMVLGMSLAHYYAPVDLVYPEHC